MKQKTGWLNSMYFLMWFLALSLFTSNPATAGVTSNNSDNWAAEKANHTYSSNKA